MPKHISRKDHGKPTCPQPPADSLVLAGDVGGTKTNLALFSGSIQNLSRLTDKTYLSKSSESLTELVEQFLKESNHPQIGLACFGIAGPVLANKVKATNLPWSVDGDQLRRHFSWPHTYLLNDLVAMACSIPHLTGEQLQPLNDVPLPESGGNIGLIAAGTGLGEALLIWDGSSYTPCPSEGGHKDFAPKNPLQWRLHQYLAAKYSHASIERVLSGQGLYDIYLFLNEEKGRQEPDWLAKLFRDQDKGAVVSQTALAGKDPFCQQALALFVEIYGAEAGNLALQAVTTGGIYIGGGISPKIAPALAEGPFASAFRAKGRMESLLATIPLRLILDSKAPLLGAAVYALQQCQR